MADFEPGPWKADLERRTTGAIEALKHDLAGLRTGRANTSLLDPVTVEVYGSAMPLSQVATVTAPEPLRVVLIDGEKDRKGDPISRPRA